MAFKTVFQSGGEEIYYDSFEEWESAFYNDFQEYEAEMDFDGDDIICFVLDGEGREL